jgi:hypothetical protein
MPGKTSIKSVSSPTSKKNETDSPENTSAKQGTDVVKIGYNDFK